MDSIQARELEDRLIGFAVRVIKVANALPKTYVGRHIAGQLLRSGTSVAPNYSEARGAESRADFVHKIRVAIKELNESSVWLKMICRAQLLNPNSLSELIDENMQLCRILNASVRTARTDLRKK